MKSNERLQVVTHYLDGSSQAYGYDGEWFATLQDAIESTLDEFTDVIEGVVSMTLIWNNGEATKAIEPTYEQELVDTLTVWLTEIGAITQWQ